MYRPRLPFRLSICFNPQTMFFPDTKLLGTQQEQVHVIVTAGITSLSKWEMNCNLLLIAPF